MGAFKKDLLGYIPSKPNPTADAIPVLQDPLFQNVIVRINILEQVLEIL